MVDLDVGLPMSEKIRISVTTDPETVRVADSLARRRKTSRSAVFRDGVHALVEADQRVAAEGMDQITRRMGDWPAEEIVHAFRYPWLREGQRLWSQLRRVK